MVIGSIRLSEGARDMTTTEDFQVSVDAAE